ncbi:MAG: hypothetical protein OXE95_03960 [Chloroflexi bacterium]|nr:hypothetical protein [Chloroflexota bacterium]MCY4246717.1 hypothetical protein [Chloroflexota bacterium]
MMHSQTDAHAMKLLDLPLLLRLKQTAIVLHSELGLTEDARGQNSALLSSIVFPRGLHTLLAQWDEQNVVGQFRYRQGEHNAHIVYLAPTLEEHDDDSIWLHMLDAMAAQAGKTGAQSLVGEVEHSHRLFETMRRAGYAVYSRQVIWRGGPLGAQPARPGIRIHAETPADQIGVAALLGSTIPPIMQAILGPSTDMAGLVYQKDAKIKAYIAYSEGKHGIYALPFVHPEALDEAPAIIAAAWQRIERSRKLPVYVCVRGYQGWLENAMRDLDLSPWLEQAVMVKHLTAGVRQACFGQIGLGAAGGRKSAATMPLGSETTYSATPCRQIGGEPPLNGQTNHRRL